MKWILFIVLCLILGLQSFMAPTISVVQPSLVATDENYYETEQYLPMATGAAYLSAMDGSVSASYGAPTGAMPGGGYMAPGERYTSNEEYPAMQDYGFIAAVSRPLSTFAADVDTAAYANLRRMILGQQTIPSDAVRIEEMINAFPYGDPLPQGDERIAINTQVGPCPWNEDHLLLRVNLKSQAIETEALPASNLVFLIDTSGSMDEANKLPLVKRSFSLLVEQLRPDDRVSIVTYAGSAEVVVEGVRAQDQATLLAAIAELDAGGGTHGSEGITTAYEIAARYATPGMNSRVILATDGDFNIGVHSEAELTRLIEEKRDSGIFLTVLGFGMGNYKDTTMQALADHGNGNATYIDTIHQARHALVEEMGATLVTVAKDVKLQVEFNPAVVEGYRLIGYENRRLQDEDFVDDTKDGGELGAGHSVTALYELIPAGAGEMAQIPLAYQQQTLTGSEDYAAVRVRFKLPQEDSSSEITQAVDASRYSAEPGSDFTLSAAIAAFGQLLAGSEFAGSADTQMITEMLRPMLSDDAGGRIVELSMLVRQSEGLYAQR